MLSVLSFFILDPFRAELNQNLAAAQAPAAIVQQVRTCATVGAPALLSRAYGDWWWTGTTMAYVAIGMRSPESVLVEVVPACAPALRAAQPFLTGARG
ncbi:MAG: hypothetical protein NTZ14_15885 [Hyphomicrobiales bacterium]|nr:hypothetical protein [Hyphomicrobiales bacterium]